MENIIKRLDRLEMEVQNLLTRIAVAESDIQNINKKLDKIDANTLWILRLIIGALITYILGLLFT